MQKIHRLLAKSLFKSIAILPHGMIYPLARLMASIAFLLDTKGKKHLYRNIQTVYSLPARSGFSVMFARQNYLVQSQIVLETIKELDSPGYCRIDGQQKFNEMCAGLIDRFGSIIFVSGHLGGWELAARSIFRAVDKGFSTFYKPSKFGVLNELVKHVRSFNSSAMISASDKSFIKLVHATVKKNGNLGFVIDQKPKNRIGLSVEFLGQQTEFVTGPEKFSERFGKPIVMIHAIRINDRHYSLNFEVSYPSSVEPPEGEKSSPLTQKLATQISRLILTYPEQWAWNYKRWKN